jgi:universal stress protein A
MDHITLPRQHRHSGLSLSSERRRRTARTAPARRAARPARLKIKHILVPLDFSEKANKALVYAMALAESLGGKITLLHVVEPVYLTTEPGMTFLPQQTATAEEHAGRKRMLKTAQELITKHLFERAVVRQGTPYREITTTAKTLNADIIVLATHGRTGLNHVLMGSTAERVVRHAPCPVLTVRRTQ